MSVPYWLPAVVAAALLGALAAWLLYLNPRSAAIRVFAAFLVLRAASGVGSSLQGSRDTAVAAHASLVEGLAFLAMVPLLVYFASLYPQRRGFLGRSRWGAAIVLLVIAILWGSALWDTDLYATFRERPGGGIEAVDTGPLIAFIGPTFLVTAILGLVFARDSTRSAEGPQRASLFLVALGFALDPLYVSVGFIGIVLGGLSFLPGVGGTVTLLLSFLIPLVTGALLFILAREARRTGRPKDRRRLRLAVALFAFALASAILSIWLSADDPYLDRASFSFTYIRGFWRLPLPLLVAYALVRHRLFDIDLKIRWTIKQSTVAAIFIAVFFVASEVAKDVFSETAGPIVGILAAGALVFVLAPMQRLAEKVASTAMPNVHDPRATAATAPLETYREAVRMALADGVVTKQEERSLARVATLCGLSPERAFEVRDEVEREASKAAKGVA